MQDSNERDATVRASGDLRRSPLRCLRAIAAGLVAATIVVGCQTSRPVPVEVRGKPAPTAPGTDAAGLPPVTQPGTSPEPVAPGGLPSAGGAIQPGLERPGAGIPSVPIGPSGQPVRTEPYGLKRAFGEPPREPRSPAAGPTRLPPSVTPAVGSPGLAGGMAAAPAGGPSTPGTTTAADPLAATAPITAPTVLPPASTLPPGTTPAAGTGTTGSPVATSPGVSPATAAAPATSPPPAPAGTAPAGATTTAPRAVGPGKINGIAFGWPLKGTLLQDFSQTSNRGLALGSRPGAAVNAAADGKVIFSGAGPREYGNLVIIKHEGDLLSVYANNSSLAVKEGQAVRRGQKIAEAGTTTSRPQLHFEIRQQGKPIDPLGVLPAP